MDGVARAMRVAISREEEKLETSLPFLATVGSTSPYIGLFGTVWGILQALTQIGVAGQASIDKVAGPVGAGTLAAAKEGDSLRLTLEAPAFYETGSPQEPVVQPQFMPGPALVYSLPWWAGGATPTLWAPAVAGGLAERNREVAGGPGGAVGVEEPQGALTTGVIGKGQILEFGQAGAVVRRGVAVADAGFPGGIEPERPGQRRQRRSDGRRQLQRQQRLFLKAMAAGWGAAGSSGPEAEDDDATNPRRARKVEEDMDEIRKQLAELQKRISRL